MAKHAPLGRFVFADFSNFPKNPVYKDPKEYIGGCLAWN